MTKTVAVGKITVDWCPYCKKMESAWNEFAKTVKAQGIEVYDINPEKTPGGIAAVNEEYKLSGEGALVRNTYPTIFYIRDGKVHYHTDETKRAAADFMTMLGSRGGGRSRRARGRSMRRRRIGRRTRRQHAL